MPCRECEARISPQCNGQWQPARTKRDAVADKARESRNNTTQNKASAPFSNRLVLFCFPTLGFWAAISHGRWHGWIQGATVLLRQAPAPAKTRILPLLFQGQHGARVY